MSKSKLGRVRIDLCVCLFFGAQQNDFADETFESRIQVQNDVG